MIHGLEAHATVGFASASKEWTQDFAVGVQEIDLQHKALFEHLNNLAKAMSQRQPAAEIASTLDFRGRYVLRA